MLDLDLARALARLYDHGAHRNPVDAKLSIATMRRLVQHGWADPVDPPKLTLTAAGQGALPDALAMLAAVRGPAR